MVRKKTEGSEEQRRAAALEARRADELPSERQATTGASKQRTHLTGRDALDHEERTGTVHRGKQQWPPPGLTEERGEPVPDRTFTDRTGDAYTAEHERVFGALAAAQEENGGEAVFLDVVARGAGLPQERTRALLHDLMEVHRLVTELAAPDNPDQGPRYETRPGLTSINKIGRAHV